MKKTFYKIKYRDINIFQQKQKLKGFNAMKANKNNSFNNNKQNIYSNDFNNNNFDINNTKQEMKDTNKMTNSNNDKNEYSYIFYGNNNKLFKTRNNNFSQYNISSKNKKNLLNKFKYGSSKQTNKNINENNKYKNINFKRQLSSDIIMNTNNDNVIRNISNKNILRKNSSEYFPDIYGFNKKRENNDLNLNYWFNDNNKGIHIDELNQLHKNFINSIKNHSGLFYDKETNNNISSDNNYINTKNKNIFLEIKNIHNQKWFHINEYMKKDRQILRNNIKTMKLCNNKNQNDINNNNNINLLYSKRKDNKENEKKISDEGKLNNLININNKKNIKKSDSIKIDKNYLKDKNDILDKKDSTNSSLLSITFSNEEYNVKNEVSNIRQNKEEIHNNINYKNSISKIFSFISKDTSFSYNSTKNMKIDEKTYSAKETNYKNIKKEEEENNYNPKFNFKTSSYFFSPNFKKNEINKNKKEDSANIKNIINNVIENNKKAAQARGSTSFYNIGNNYLNNKMRNSQKNFYSSSNKNNKNSYFSSADTNFSKDQAREKTVFSKAKKKSNYIQLTLLSPAEWEKHEDVWINISNKKYGEDFEQFFLPPNDTDILISSYLKMYPNKLNICNYSKINTLSKNEKEFLSFCIDDDIVNPKIEIKKWKNVYKKMIFRWHPDKLFPLINELKIKNDFIRKEIERRSSLIINNINVLYQNIMEILKKILLSKEKSNK